ncbi:MAG: hypothetical protein K8S55_08100 [Phycisphaerae bacterium]|nr:hypothetical protein [Phycisphaerae bacterium]
MNIRNTGYFAILLCVMVFEASFAGSTPKPDAPAGEDKTRKTDTAKPQKPDSTQKQAPELKTPPAKKPTTPSAEKKDKPAPAKLQAKSSANPSKLPQRWALLIYHARRYKPILIKHYGWDEKNIILVDGKLTPKKVAAGFAKIPKLSRDDLFFFSSCHHAAPKCLFNRRWPWRKVEKELKRIGATTVVTLEVCHGGLAMELLPSSDVVYSGADAFSKCGGIFMGLFRKALTDPASDTNGDGYVSLGEVYDIASKRKPLVEGYTKLRKSRPKFWPTKFVPRPVRSPGRRGYQIHLGANWDLARAKKE